MRNPVYKILAGFVLFTSCHSYKKVQNTNAALSKKDTTQVVNINDSAAIPDSVSIIKNIIKNLSQNQIDFSTFQAKIKVDYEGKDESGQGTANLRMFKDSVIWISLTGPLGIEVFRLLVNKNSVTLINKLERTVLYRNINYLQELTEIPLDFKGLQDLIIGNPVFLDTAISSYKTTENELLILITGKIFKHLITLSKTDFKITHSKLEDVNAARNRTCNITYSGYENQDNISFSTARKITVAERSKLNVELVFKQYQFNQPITFPFTISKNYTRE